MWCTGEMSYVNLLLNPERYTGYKGESARRIWQAIYMELGDKGTDSIFVPHFSKTGMIVKHDCEDQWI